MTKALKELLEKVETGKGDTFYAPVWLRSDTLRIKAKEAHDGSRDAAKALKTALVPHLCMTTRETIEGVEVILFRPVGKESGCMGYEQVSAGFDLNGNDGRAGVIAILKAKIAEGEG